MLTQQQIKFCKYIALYEMQPYDAFVNAGYEVKQKRYIHERVVTLLNNKQISDYIDMLRRKYLDLEYVRKDIILNHQKAIDFDLTTVFSVVPYNDENGVKRFRLDVKPVAEWSLEARQNLVGFDNKTGMPIFKDKEAAAKEISRIFGLYKDNTVVVEENFDDLYADALGESSGVSDKDDVFVDVSNMADREEMETLDSQLMQMGDEEQASKEKMEELDKKIEANPEDANKIKLWSLLNK